MRPDSHRPPQLDEFFSIAEAPLRAIEFDSLGWTEDDRYGDVTVLLHSVTCPADRTFRRPPLSAQSSKAPTL